MKNTVPSPTADFGIVMLDTHFPRIAGDVGNPDTWPFPVLYRTVRGAGARAVVEQTREQQLQPFIDAALDLQHCGVRGITTSCGFLVLYQQQIAEALSVPFLASSLLQWPWVQQLMPAGQVAGILTIRADALQAEHLQAAGIDWAPIQGLDVDTHFSQCILGDHATLDASKAEAEHVEAAQRLIDNHPETGAIILECSNMSPYAAAIQQAVQRPVFSLVSLIRWWHMGQMPVLFDRPS